MSLVYTFTQRQVGNIIFGQREVALVWTKLNFAVRLSVALKKPVVKGF